jgi:rhamnosyltransferase
MRASGQPKIKYSTPKVAVLLAAHEGMRWIEDQIMSILGQRGVNVTLFVSVDISYDGTQIWVDHLAQINPSVVMLPYGERFGSAAQNFFRLLRDVTLDDFDAVAFADQDDIWFEDKLARACNFLQMGRCDVYSSNVIAYWPNGRRLLIEKSAQQRRFDHFFESAGPGCTYVFKLASASRLKEFVIRMRQQLVTVSCHDWLAYAYCREQQFSWFIDPEPSMLYRQHSFNQMGVNIEFKAMERRLKMIRKHWYRDQVNLTLSLVAPSKVEIFKRKISLMFYINQLRRRSRDRWYLLLIFVLGFY